MTKEFTCIVCPNGCSLSVQYDEAEEGKVVSKVSGNICQKGEEYGRQEIEAPTRTIASSVRVTGGALPLVSVRTDGAIPKDRIFDVMNEIRALNTEAPVSIGQTMIKNVLGLQVDVIATKNVAVAAKNSD